MATTSPDNILTPDAGDQYALVQDLGIMADSIQTALAQRGNAMRGTASQRASAQASALPGMLWQDTDGIRMLWKRGVTAWEPAVWRWAGTTTQMNSFSQAPTGFEWRDTSSGLDYQRVSGAWVCDGTFVANMTSGTFTGGSVYPLTNGSQWAQVNELTGSTWVNGLRVPRAGTYSVTFTFSMLSSVLILPLVKLNSTTPNTNGAIAQAYFLNTGGISPMSGFVTRTIRLNASDVLTPAIYTPTGGTYTPDYNATSFSVTRV